MRVGEEVESSNNSRKRSSISNSSSGKTFASGRGWKKIARVLFLPPLPSFGVPPEKKTSTPCRNFFRKEDLRVPFALLHCAP